MENKTIIDTYEEKRKCISDFNLVSDLFAGKVLEDIEACQELCRILLQNGNIVINNVKTQYTISNIENHSVTLDIFAENSSRNLINIEIQMYEEPAPLKRSRYYISSIDISILEKGLPYHQLPDVRMIYITKVNELLQYFKNSNPFYHTENFPRIVERVNYFKVQKEGVDIMCEIADRMRKEGRIESKVEDILELLEDLGKIPQRILECIKQETDLDILSKWLKYAAKATSIAEFETNMY